MPTLVLPPRYTPDSTALGKAASRDGWRVERLPSWRVPDGFDLGDCVLYGEPLFASVVAAPLGVTLLEPPFDWLPRLPESYRLRSVRLTTLAGARSEAFPAFVKPADDKCFAAGVYDDHETLPVPGIVPEATPVLVAEPVAWEVEFRSFVAARRVRTISPYWRDGESAQAEDGSWDDPRTAEAEAFAGRVLSDGEVPFPPGVVLDVGLIRGRGWAVVELNAAWGSGVYGCDPREVLEVLRRCCLPSDRVSAEDRAWVVDRGG